MVEDVFLFLCHLINADERNTKLVVISAVCRARLLYERKAEISVQLVKKVFLRHRNLTDNSWFNSYEHTVLSFSYNILILKSSCLQ